MHLCYKQHQHIARDTNSTRALLPTSSPASTASPSSPPSPPPSSASSSTQRSRLMALSYTAVKSSPPRARSARSILTSSRSNLSTPPYIFATISSTPRHSVSCWSRTRNSDSSSWTETARCSARSLAIPVKLSTSESENSIGTKHTDQAGSRSIYPKSTAVVVSPPCVSPVCEKKSVTTTSARSPSWQSKTSSPPTRSTLLVSFSLVPPTSRTI
jgi:hypothetical protein